MDRGALTNWLDAYGAAWETRNPNAAVALFAEGALYQETPFGDPMRGPEAIRRYWSRVPQDQRDVSFGYEILSVDPAMAHWWASYTEVATGEATKLDGVFVLEFDRENRCTSLREWWHAHPRPAF
ncbi:MAG: nuclear transport factor 2 family protein [Acidimicrobiia bacterium]